jgi:hypothetical protein
MLTSALDRGEWSASCPICFTPRERSPRAHWIGGWVGSRASLHVVSKRKIPSPHQDSNTYHVIVQPIVSCYTDWWTGGCSSCLSYKHFKFFQYVYSAENPFTLNVMSASLMSSTSFNARTKLHCWNFHYNFVFYHVSARQNVLHPCIWVLSP